MALLGNIKEARVAGARRPRIMRIIQEEVIDVWETNHVVVGNEKSTLF